jgi:hypothetical protein
VNAHAAPHGRLYDGFIVESCNDTEVVATSAQGPVQIGEEFWRRVDDDARRGDDFVRSDIITSKTVRVCEVANPSTESKTANTDVCSLDRVKHMLDNSSVPVRNVLGHQQQSGCTG